MKPARWIFSFLILTSFCIVQAQSLLPEDMEFKDIRFEERKKEKSESYLFDAEHTSLSYGMPNDGKTEGKNFQSILKHRIAPSVETFHRIETSSTQTENHAQNDALKGLQFKQQTGLRWETSDFLTMDLSRSVTGTPINLKSPKQETLAWNSDINLSKWTKIAPVAEWNLLESYESGSERSNKYGIRLNQQVGESPFSLDFMPSTSYRRFRMEETENIYSRCVEFAQNVRWTINDEADLLIGANLNKEQSFDDTWWEHTKEVFGEWTRKISDFANCHLRVDHTDKTSSAQNQEWLGMKLGPEIKVHEDWMLGLDMGHQLHLKSVDQPQETSFSLSVKGVF